KNDYARAEEYYKTALALGSDQAITYYALGINAFASKRFEDAKTYLNKAAEIAPDKYADKVKELLARIEAGG
ncbi:MAG TPA: tetratricopeptide repeat protein, partial [Spirochaetales bacterium]|nr:tetratricopeptide repeat protein [Spirochaetales bacterium]